MVGRSPARTLHRCSIQDTSASAISILVRTILDPAACACGRSKGAFGWAGAYGTTSWTDPRNDLVAVYYVQQRVLEAEAEFGQVLPTGSKTRSVR